VRRERGEERVELLLALRSTAEPDQAEDAGRGREHHRVARPLRKVFARRGERFRRGALDRQRDRVDVALLARRGRLRELARPRGGRARGFHVGVEEAPARERGVRECERRIGLDRAAELRAPPGSRREETVGGGDVRVACDRRGRGEDESVAVDEHGASLHRPRIVPRRETRDSPTCGPPPRRA